MNDQWRGKRILILGSGISAVGAAKLAAEIGAVPVILEENEKLTPGEVGSKLGEEAGDKAEIYIGSLPEEAEKNISLVVPSPGIPMNKPILSSFQKKGVPIISEIEFAYRHAGGRLVAITGTNGKTTTTKLVSEILAAAYPHVYTVGNIGYSYAGLARQMEEDSIAVAEVSSFQLEAVSDFHPQVALVLNVTPDHLDRHGDMDSYAGIKERIGRGQTGEDYLILNWDNPYTRAMGEKSKAKQIYFSSGEMLDRGLYLKGDAIYYSDGDRRECLIDLSEIHLLGTCNAENVMAAIAAGMAMSVPMEQILPVVRNFPPVEHRIEFVGKKRGVSYYNDSKATNPDSAIQGIGAMKTRTLLIGGGYDKEALYDDWILSFEGRVRKLILLGQTGEKIAACARKHGFEDYVLCRSFEEALETASREAGEGEAVLLSPACASWDMFSNYEERGRAFKAYVAGLT